MRTSNVMPTRREAMAVAAGAAFSGWSRSAAAVNSAYSDKQYAAAMVIDALGGPGGFEPGIPDDAPLLPKWVADARASGITAVNVTVGDVGNGPTVLKRRSPPLPRRSMI